MTAPGPTPEKKALDYVESLGLNSVYNEAVSARNVLDAQHKRLLELRSEKRRLENFRADREMEVTEEERIKNPEMSMTAFEKHLKVAFSNDGDIRETRDELSTLAGEIDYVEYEIECIHQDIKIAVARLHELGGYFQFMAVIKQASESRKSRETSQDGNPWT